MPAPAPPPSARRTELLELAYRYVLERGLGELSLRPLAAAIGSSTGVLMFLFGSKDGLITALLERARADELAVLDSVRTSTTEGDLRAAAEAVWDWLVASRHRAVLGLWLEAYARSLIDPDGPWDGFAGATVRDWLALLDGIGRGGEDRTLLLAVLRGALLDLLATGDVERVDGAVRHYLAGLPG